MAFDNILIDPNKKAAIQERAPDKMPLNPTAQGWTGQQVRAALAAATTGNVDSILSELETKLGVIKGHFESYVGNVSILPELPLNLATYNNTFIFIKSQNGRIQNIFYISEGVAIPTKFTSSNLTISNVQPEIPANDDVWFDTSGTVIEEVIVYNTTSGGAFTTTSFANTLSGGAFNEIYVNIINGGNF
jgi:hypothetical protein